MTYALPWSLSAIPADSSHRSVSYKDIEEPCEYEERRGQKSIYMSKGLVRLLKFLDDSGSGASVAEVRACFNAATGRNDSQESDKTAQHAIYNGLVTYDEDCRYRLTPKGRAELAR
jgi:hypothetical protein